MRPSADGESSSVSSSVGRRRGIDRHTRRDPLGTEIRLNDERTDRIWDLDRRIDPSSVARALAVSATRTSESWCLRARTGFTSRRDPGLGPSRGNRRTDPTGVATFRTSESVARSVPFPAPSRTLTQFSPMSWKPLAPDRSSSRYAISSPRSQAWSGSETPRWRCCTIACVMTCHHDRWWSLVDRSLRLSTATGDSAGELVISFEIVSTPSTRFSRAQSRYRFTWSAPSWAVPVFTSTRHIHEVLPRSTRIAPSGM